MAENRNLDERILDSSCLFPYCHVLEKTVSFFLLSLVNFLELVLPFSLLMFSNLATLSTTWTLIALRSQPVTPNAICNNIFPLTRK
jgi:hypothetical protein